MKTKIFMALAALVIATAGCVTTVSDTKTPGMPFGRDSVGGRYQRSVDEVYGAAIKVINTDGTGYREFARLDIGAVIDEFPDLNF